MQILSVLLRRKRRFRVVTLVVLVRVSVMVVLVWRGRNVRHTGHMVVNVLMHIAVMVVVMVDHHGLRRCTGVTVLVMAVMMRVAMVVILWRRVFMMMVAVILMIVTMMMVLAFNSGFPFGATAYSAH